MNVMNPIGSAFSAGLSAAGDTFYAHAASRNATEEKGLANLLKKDANEAENGLWDTLTGLFVKAFPQTYFTVALTSQLQSHLTFIGASEGMMTASFLLSRFLPAVPMLLAAAPLIGFANGLSGEKANGDKLLQDGVQGMETGRFFQKLGNYTSRTLEVAYAALLISRIVNNDGRFGACVGIATLVAGLVYRYDLLNDKIPSASSVLDKMFTWEPSVVPYALGGAALVAGPTRIMVIFMLFYQGIRDLFLTASKQQDQNEAAPQPEVCLL